MLGIGVPLGVARMAPLVALRPLGASTDLMDNGDPTPPAYAVFDNAPVNTLHYQHTTLSTHCFIHMYTPT